MSVQVNGENVFTKEMANVFETEVIECPDCGFEFSTKHEQHDEPGIYKCPCCNEANLEVLYLNLQTDVKEAADLHFRTILELQRIQSIVHPVDDPVNRPIGVALNELEAKFHKIHDKWSETSKVVETRYDSNGKQIKEHDVLKNVETGEMAITVYAKNKAGVRGLAVENKIIGSGDWLDVYPDGVWTIVGNAGISPQP